MAHKIILGNLNTICWWRK